MLDDNGLTQLLSGRLLNGDEDVKTLTGEKDLPDDFFGRVEIDTANGEPCFVIEVQFPHILDGKDGYQPGQAAFRDWSEKINEVLGKDVTVVATEHTLLEVRCPLELLRACLELLASQPSVHWLHPKPKSQLHNWRASGIIQSGQAPPKEDGREDPDIHPIWSAGIRGEDQIVGCGDSGIDVDSCFFFDPAIQFADGIKMSGQNGGKQFFESNTHRKVQYYQGTADLIDINGHGSHVVGSILGNPYYNTDPQSSANRGMAPHARVAFMDLGGDDSRSIYTPRELSKFYYPNTYERGARIHSDSWGSDSPVYDVLSMEVDKFTWEHKDFLPIFAAGNYGELSQKYLTTVTSPAVAKNCLAVGATLTADQPAMTTREERVVTYEIKVEAAMDNDGTEVSSFKLLEAWFGGSWEQLIRSSGEGGIPLVAANPRVGCTPVTNALGAIVLMERGDCKYVTKLRNAAVRGAKGVIVTNNIQQGYFEMIAAANVTTSDLTIPMGSVPISIGRELWQLVESGRSVVLRVSGKTDPRYSFDNIADFSSAGPTPDHRLKPDIVAPGRIKSAWSDGEISSSAGQCKMFTMSGTSMATPIVAGAAALVRQYFTDGYYPSGEVEVRHKFSPSAALIKASILGGAFAMDGFTEAGLPLEPPPSFRQGFGRVLLERSIPVRQSRQWKNGWRMQVVDGAELNTGESHDYCVRALGGPVKVTLVWTDYPASPTVHKALVNDLDLVVRSAGLRGRVLPGNGIEDRVNNVEQVSMEDLPEGNIAITVKAHFVLAAHGPQSYALVVHGHFNGILQSAHNPVAKPNSGDKACIITLAVIKEGPEGATNSNSPEFVFTTQSEVDPISGFECQLTDMDGRTDWGPTYDWKDCKSPAKHEKLPDKAYKFSVRPKGEDVIASRMFQVDTKPPDVLIFGEPTPARTSQEEAVFEFAAGDASPVSFTCRFLYDGPHRDWFQAQDMYRKKVDLDEWFPCGSPQRLQGIPYGNWEFHILATDSAGNKKQEATKHKWMTFFKPNVLYARTISLPLRVVSSQSSSFLVQALEGVRDAPPTLLDVPLECSLQSIDDLQGRGPSWEPCNARVNYTGIQDGTYQFQARTRDPRGHGPDSVSRVNITVDRTPPIVRIVQKPGAYHGARTVRLKFESTEEVLGYRCSLVPKGKPEVFDPCTVGEDGGAEYELEDASYVFRVIAEDHAGNLGSSETVEFMVDSKPPVIMVKSPTPGNRSEITVAFDVMDNGGSGVIPANISCLLRNEGREMSVEWLPNCKSPQDYTLDEGRHVFKVRAVDRAGLHAESSDHIIVVDKTPPSSKITSKPPNGAQPPFVAFKFKGQDKPEQIASLVAYHECRLTAFIPVPPPTAGNTSSPAKSDTDSYRIAASRGAQSQLQSISGEQSSIQIKDGAAVELGKWVLCESPVVLIGMRTGHYLFQTRAIDKAGNVGNTTHPEAFQVDDMLPVPGEDKSSTRAVLDKWVWIAIGVTAVTGVLITIAAITVCRLRSKSKMARHGHTRARARARGCPRSSRYCTPGPSHQNRSRALQHNTLSQEVSSGASDDPMLALAIKASMQQQELDGEERRRRREREENVRLQAAVQASMEDYQCQQAVGTSQHGTQENWGECLFPQHNTVGGLTSTSPWVLRGDEPNSNSWSSQNAHR